MSSGAIVEYSYNQNTKIKFDDYKGLDPDQINPFMGKIAGSMSASTIRNVSVSGATLDHGDLPEKYRDWFMNPWHYPRQYIGAEGNGACGKKDDSSTITNTNWSPDA